MVSTSAEQGSKKAQFKLGTAYATGKGVLMDAVQAHVWLNIAAASGYEDAREVKKLVAKTMSATEISKAQDSARQCVQNDYKVCWRTKQLHSTPTPLTKDKPPMQLNEKLLKLACVDDERRQYIVDPVLIIQSFKP